MARTAITQRWACSIRGRAFKIKREKCGEEVVVGDGGVPAVGGEDGGVESFVGQVEPGGALVVEGALGGTVYRTGAAARGSARRSLLAAAPPWFKNQGYPLP
jgi:hypothetical protein